MDANNKQAAGPSGRSRTRYVAPAFRGVMRGIACFTLLSGICAGPAMAMGFGDITRNSALGQPFLAEVKLIGVNADINPRCFKVALTTLDGERLGTPTFNLNTGDGAARLYVGTREAVGEPAVQVSVEYICMPATRRDYQILLDLEKPAANAPAEAADKSTPAAAAPADAAPQRVRRHRSAEAAAPAVSSEIAPAPPVGLKSDTASNAALEKKHARHAAKEFRNVLRLGDDPSVDDNLNGEEGLHLSLSHGLNGENSDLDAKNPPPPDAAQASDNAPAVAAASDTDAQLKQLQDKISKLEAQTEELRQLNARQTADLESARQDKAARGSQLYLYILLLACIVAIGWLAWRSRQIQVGIEHSWEDALPEEEEAEQRPRHHAHHGIGDDDFPDAAPDVDTTELDYPLDALDANDAPPAPAPAVRKADFMATLAMRRAEESETGESEYKFPSGLRQALPSAEEILDEIQQAEFWMDMQQPQRAIEILESNWGSDRPTSPLPWLYLFDLYRTVGDKDKYLELTERFEQIFNGKVISWEEKDLPQHQRGLEDFPVLLKKITQLWRTDQIVPFMENLLVDDRDGRRQGFDLNAFRDILFLTNIAYDNRDSGAAAASEMDAPDWSVLNH